MMVEEKMVFSVYYTHDNMEGWVRDSSFMSFKDAQEMSWDMYESFQWCYDGFDTNIVEEIER